MDNRLSSVQGLFKFSTSDGAAREYGLNSGRQEACRADLILGLGGLPTIRVCTEIYRQTLRSLILDYDFVY